MNETTKSYINLLKKLENNKLDCKQYVINESSLDDSFITKLNTLIPAAPGLDKEMTNKILHTPMSEESRIFMYPGFSTPPNYRIDTDSLLNMAVEEIEKSIENDRTLSKSDIIRNSIHKISMEILKKNINSIPEFRDAFRLAVYGSYKKIYNIPRPYQMLANYKFSQNAIKQLDIKIISLSEFRKKISKVSTNISIKYELNKQELNLIKDILEKVGETSYDILTSMRAAFVGLTYEYEISFKQLAKRKYSQNNESYDNISELLKVLNESYNEFKNINIDDELIDDTKTESLKKITESLRKISEMSFFKDIVKDKIHRKELLNKINDSLYLISKISQDSINSTKVHIYKSINQPDNGLSDIIRNINSVIEVFSKELKDNYLVMPKKVLSQFPNYGEEKISVDEMLKNSILSKKEDDIPNIEYISSNLLEMTKNLTTIDSNISIVTDIISAVIKELNETFKTNTDEKNCLLLKCVLNSVCVIMILNKIFYYVYNLGINTLNTLKVFEC